MTKPLIGITTWRRNFDTDLGADRPVLSLGTEYAAPVEAAGAAVVLLAPTAGVDEVLDRLDAVVLSGGNDLDPRRYGASPEEGTRYDADRDEFEIALVKGARTRGIPVLAICRGMQVANVAFGGTLIVDIENTAHHKTVQSNSAQLAERHPIALAADSALAQVYGATDRVVNTIHHQAIDQLAPGMRAVAWAPDGVIEAMELVDNTDEWIFWAVQWHPEKMSLFDEEVQEQALFTKFVKAAQERRAEASAHTKGTK